VDMLTWLYSRTSSLNLFTTTVAVAVTCGLLYTLCRPALLLYTTLHLRLRLECYHRLICSTSAMIKTLIIVKH